MKVRHVLIGMLLALLFAARPNLAAEATITIDLTKPIHEVTHVASGFLHPFSMDMKTPPVDKDGFYIAPLAPRFIRVVTGQIVPVHQRLPDATMIATFSGSWGVPFQGKPSPMSDWDKFEAFVRTTVQTAKDAGVHPIYDAWNEPDAQYFLGLRGKGGWKGATWDDFYELYARCYKIIRQIDPQAKITGPSIGGGWPDAKLWTYMEAFRDYCVKNNCIPDYWNYHFPDDRILDQVARIKSWNLHAGLLIPEYLGRGSDTYPAALAYEIAFEEEAAAYPGHFGVSGCTKASWGENKSFRGSLGGCLFNNGPELSRRGIWWVYERYAKMNGMRFTAESPQNMRALVAYDTDAKAAWILLGAKYNPEKQILGYSGPVTLALSGVAGQAPTAAISVIPYADNGAVDELAPAKPLPVQLTGTSATISFAWEKPTDALLIRIDKIAPAQ